MKRKGSRRKGTEKGWVVKNDEIYTHTRLSRYRPINYMICTAGLYMTSSPKQLISGGVSPGVYKLVQTFVGL